jgi:hypothetical protein
MRKSNARTAAAISAAVLLGGVVTAFPAHAGDANFTERAGSCSGLSSWDLKAKPNHRRLELEFSVETRRAGQTWRVRVSDNGRRVYAGKRVTNRISRSLSVDRMVANRAGPDRLVGWARNVRTGEVCRGRVAMRAAGSGETPG